MLEQVIEQPIFESLMFEPRLPEKKYITAKKQTCEEKEDWGTQII